MGRWGTNDGRGRGRGLLIALLALLTTLAIAPGGAAGAAEGDVGVEGPAYVQGDLPTVTMAESKLWFHDGTWFAAMLKTGTPTSGGGPNADVVIHRRVGTDWVPTSTVIDTRGTAKQDVVSVGDTLYVLSHRKVEQPDGVASTDPQQMTRLYTFTYDGETGSYAPVSGFPVVVNAYRVESITMDVDSTGALWVAWAQTGQVLWQRSTDGGATWSSPTALTVAHASPSPGEIASLVAFGDRVGIMWADREVGADDGYWFTSTPAGSAAPTWTATEAAFAGDNLGEDHISLKSVNGQVVAAVKTRVGLSANPLVVLLTRSTTGTWGATNAWAGTTRATRPVVTIDATNGVVHLFATVPNGSTTAESGVYTKSTPLASPAFTPGELGTPVMTRTGGSIADVTSTKQGLTAASDLVVLAADQSTQRYWSNGIAIGSAGPDNHRPFASAAAFAEQQAQDFHGRSATDAEVAAVGRILVGEDQPGSAAVLAPEFFAHSSVAGSTLRGLQAQVTRLYLAYYLRMPDKGGLDYWIGQRKAGKSLALVSQDFASAREFRTLYGSLTNRQFVERIYQNILGRPGEPGGVNYWTGELDARRRTRGSVMIGFSESGEYIEATARTVSVVLVYRRMLDRVPTKAELEIEKGRASMAAVVDSILASTDYRNRVTS